MASHIDDEQPDLSLVRGDRSSRGGVHYGEVLTEQQFLRVGCKFGSSCLPLQAVDEGDLDGAIARKRKRKRRSESSPQRLYHELMIYFAHGHTSVLASP